MRRELEQCWNTAERRSISSGPPAALLCIGALHWLWLRWRSMNAWLWAEAAHSLPAPPDLLIAVAFFCGLDNGNLSCNLWCPGDRLWHCVARCSYCMYFPPRGSLLGYLQYLLQGPIYIIDSLSISLLRGGGGTSTVCTSYLLFRCWSIEFRYPGNHPCSYMPTVDTLLILYRVLCIYFYIHIYPCTCQSHGE